MRARFVDFHVHLDLYKDHLPQIVACDAKGVATLAVTTTPKAWDGNRRAVARSTHVRVALGLHPQLVGERAHELDHLLRLLPSTRFVGEVGLDAGPRFFRSLPEQERVFTTILKACAGLGSKVLTVHSVRATKKVLDLIEAHLPPDRGRVVLHWFSGTAAEARRATELGCYFSVNLGMFETPRGASIAAVLPLERVLTETDGPFVSMDGEPLKPGQVEPVLDRMATARGINAQALNRAVLANLGQLLT